MSALNSLIPQDPRNLNIAKAVGIQYGLEVAMNRASNLSPNVHSLAMAGGASAIHQYLVKDYVSQYLPDVGAGEQVSRILNKAVGYAASASIIDVAMGHRMSLTQSLMNAGLYALLDEGVDMYVLPKLL